MSFAHEDREFADLLRIVAEDRGVVPALVEKDYWVTHTLWALQEQGLELWFKGGTSLSKGFGIIHRFSEDLDLKIEAGTASGIPVVGNWKSLANGAIAMRRSFFDSLQRFVRVPGASTELDLSMDPKLRSAGMRVLYPGIHVVDIAHPFRPFVLLEIGHARVVPFLRRDLSSFVHDHLRQLGVLTDYDQNCPRGVRCVHPMVTLLEKLDAIARRFAKGAAAATFVRHFEDAARIIECLVELPPIDSHAEARDLVLEMAEERQIVGVPAANDEAFLPDDSDRWSGVRAAYRSIAPMFWGDRVSLEGACKAIRGWVVSNLGDPSS